MKTWTVRDAWDRFLLYVPIAAMAALALGSYWLVRSTPELKPVESARPLRHEPDYFIEGFSIKNFDGTGRIRTQIAGSKARHFPDTLTLEIDEVDIRSFSELGRLTTGAANQAIANQDASQVQLLGNAVVVREEHTVNGLLYPRLEFRGEFLHFFTNEEVVKSHKPIELVRGKDRFTAESLEFDNVDQVLKLQGRVRGTLAPAGS